MVVKDKAGRRRYVVFAVEAERPPSTRAFAHSLQACMSPRQRARIDPRVVQFDGTWGILRCSHLHKDGAIAALQSIRSVDGNEARVTTVGTSGTIRRARRKYIP